MFPLTKMQTINYIKENSDCFGDCDTCLLSSFNLRNIGISPTRSCRERFLLFVRKIDKDLKVDTKITGNCVLRQEFLLNLTKKFSSSKFLPNED